MQPISTSDVHSANVNVAVANAPLVLATGLQKSFHGVPALRNGSIRLRPGTVHALCGGNGAGKSTFLNILMGLLPRDAGTVQIKGEEVIFLSPADALHHGVAMITQELSPVPDMTVAENLYLGREPKHAGVLVNFSKMKSDAQKLLDSLKFEVSAGARMGSLSLAQIQLVEIAKALSYDADIVIMDEPTSAIGEHEVGILFEAIQRVTHAGKGIIYVSHKLTEIFEIAEDYTVFRDGEVVESGLIRDIDRAHLVRQIVGREVTITAKEPMPEAAPVALKVRNFTRLNEFEDISLEVHRGEVVGIYGLLGSGRTEFLEALYGITRATSGTAEFEGKALPAGDPGASIKSGLALVSEDRKGSGLVLSSSVAHNISLSSFTLASLASFVNKKKESEVVADMISKQRIRTSSPDIEVEALSGGNQQKVVFARCLTTNPRLLICDEPTRGIDEGSKQEIYAFLRNFAKEGNSVLVVSSEAPEILQLSDRIAVFRRGRLVETLPGEGVSQQQLIDRAS